MQQYYLKQNLIKNIEISGDVYHHLVNVVRINVNEEIILFNELEKGKYNVEKIDFESNILRAKLIEEIINQSQSFQVDLAFGFLKKDKNELVIQKATELGVDNIYLVRMQNSIMKITSDKQEKKLKRYKDIAINASEQSKRFTTPNVYIEDGVNELLNKKYDYIYLLYEKESANNFVNVIRQDELTIDKKILLIVGPEGGFAKDELECLKDKSKFVTINDNILRAETAAIVGIGIIKNFKE